MVKKILIVGPSWVGDMVMAQSLFKLLKERHPDAVIDVLAQAWSFPLLKRMPEVASAILMPIGHGELKLRERYRIAKSLREKQYDQAIVLPNSFKSALILFWAKIPIRTGWRGEMRWGVLNDIRPLDKAHYPLMIERFLALGLVPNASLPHPYPLPQLQITAESQEAAFSKHIKNSPQYSKEGNKEKKILVLCPGAEFGPAKRWPEEHYADIANAKLKEGWSVWLLGSPKDIETTAKIMELTQQRCIDLAGKTKLEEAIDLLAMATMVVSNDSGLMHIAAALHKPLIAIYGPTSASFTPPLHDKAKVLSLTLSCQPCFERTCPLKHNRCMKDLLPEKVLKVINDLCAP